MNTLYSTSDIRQMKLQQEYVHYAIRNNGLKDIMGFTSVRFI